MFKVSICTLGGESGTVVESGTLAHGASMATTSSSSAVMASSSSNQFSSSSERRQSAAISSSQQVQSSSSYSSSQQASYSSETKQESAMAASSSLLKASQELAQKSPLVRRRTMSRDRMNVAAQDETAISSVRASSREGRKTSINSTTQDVSECQSY